MAICWERFCSLFYLEAMIRFLEWDTNCFGFKVGRVDADSNFNVDKIRQEALSNHFKLLYIYTNTQQQQLSDFFCDTKLTFENCNIVLKALRSNGVGSYKGRMIDEDIYSIALESGLYSRYNLDPNFPHNCFEKLYRCWIENSVFTDFADDVLIHSTGNNVNGLLTYKVSERTAVIGIVAIGEKFRGKGIGSSLMNYYHSQLIREKVMRSVVVTQGVNIDACFFYKKCGYHIINKQYIYHLWL